jgi:hypothetical protein
MWTAFLVSYGEKIAGPLVPAPDFFRRCKRAVLSGRPFDTVRFLE